MKLGSIKATEGNKQKRDGELCVISKNLKFAVNVSSLFPATAENLLSAVENWDEISPRLQKIYEQLSSENISAGSKVDGLNVIAMETEKFHSALPRTWLFADGSAFIHHIKLVRMARKAALPETLTTVPLIYQGECGKFLNPTEKIPQVDFAHGTDFEGEVGVIVADTPMGISAEDAIKKIRLVVLINDVSLRGLIPEELAQGFGFFQSKPSSALSPVACTVDELGSAWIEGRLHLPLQVHLNEKFFGKANAGAMHFHFGQLIAHAARTRDLVAGSLIGSGTVANEDSTVGSSCLAEKRMLEQIQTGTAVTSFMKKGDRIQIWMEDDKGNSIFGKIDQTVG